MSVEKITWIASYPKSGNTWLRMLLNAYKQNGYVNINESIVTSGDNLEYFTRVVSPLPLEHLGFRGKLLLRPAALLHQLTVSVPRPLFIKTHHVNGQVDVLPHLIPKDLTERAIYVVRDPRDVASSFATHVKKPIDEIIQEMNNPAYGLANEGTIPHCLNTWSTHVSSWINTSDYPVLLVRYEDMIEDVRSELIRVLEFCKMDIDESLVDKAVEACHISKLREQESSNGFRERKRDDYTFFYKGGSRWKSKLDMNQVGLIEQDHSDMMIELRYELSNREAA